MKKRIILALLLLIVVAGIIYLSLTYSRNAPASSDITATVPAQTLFFARSTENVEQAKSSVALRRARFDVILAQHPHLADNAAKMGQAGRLLAGLIAVNADKPDTGKIIPGAAPAPQWAIYTVGIIPVLRIQLTDADAFKSFIDDAEKQGDAHAVQEQYQGVSFRSYSIKPDNHPIKTTLIVAIRKHAAIVTLDVPKLRDQSLPIALGITKPTESLADSGLVKKVADENGFSNDGLAIVNHSAIFAALTGTPGSRAAAMLDKLPLRHDLAALHSPECQQDMQAIAAIWPYTATGVVADDTADDNVIKRHATLVSRLTDPPLTTALGKLRGHIPAAVVEPGSPAIVSFALGLNISNLGPVLSKLQERFIQADYKCQWLVDAQQSLQRSNPASKLAAAALVSDVRGASISLYGLDGTSSSKLGLLHSIDAMLVISTRHPRQLFRLFKRSRPSALGSITLPPDGQAISLAGGHRSLLDIQAMVAGDHLVIFAGATAAKEAHKLVDDTLAENGIMASAIDYERLIPIVVDIMAQNAHHNPAQTDKTQAIQDRLKEIQKFKPHYRVLLDFADSGITIDSHSSVTLPQ